MSIIHQYHTSTDVAEQCVAKFIRAIGTEACQQIQVIVETSCGGREFLQPLKKAQYFKACNIIPVDVAPDVENDGMTLSDYVALRVDCEISTPEKTAVVGNPPFGHNEELAGMFLGNAVQIANYVALILPPDFSMPKKYSPLVSSNYQLLVCDELESEIFEMSDGTLYKTGACFQIWQRAGEQSLD